MEAACLQRFHPGAARQSTSSANPTVEEGPSTRLPVRSRATADRSRPTRGPSSRAAGRKARLLAAIFNPCGLPGDHAARIPEISPVLPQDLGRARNQHAIRALPAHVRRGTEHPAQPRLLDVDAQRVRQVLAAESLNGEVRRLRSAAEKPRRSRWQSDQDDCQQYGEVAPTHECILALPLDTYAVSPCRVSLRPSSPPRIARIPSGPFGASRHPAS